MQNLRTKTKRKLHFNRTQLRAAAVNANTECHIVSRGEGKTQGILANRQQSIAMALPRGMSVIAHRDYESMLTKTLPPLIQGLENLGFVKDYHYIIGKKAPKKWQRYGKWLNPYFNVIKPEYFIHWFNGHGTALVSFNRDNSSNGISFDALLLDEAKFITKKYKTRLDEELIPAMRGNLQYFKDAPLYGSITYTTDQPTAADAKWLYEIEQQMDTEVIEMIYVLRFQLQQLKQKLLIAKSKETKKRIIKRMARLQSDLNYFRKNAVFYHEPPGLENFELLGEDTYRRWKRTLPELVFRTSILNERLVAVQDGFYPLLDETYHVVTYRDSFLENNAHDANFSLDSLKRNNSRHDSDIMANKPLDIALDWGDHINCLVVAQSYLDEYHITNAMFVKKPDKLQKLAYDFCEYYKHHREKYVNLPYDQTAYAGHGAFNSTYLDEFVNILRSKGWVVNTINIGQTKSHEFRYMLWSDLLSENGVHPLSIRFNANNTEYLVLSMQQAPVKQGRKGFEKDKTSEKDRKNTPQEEATHFSDAADTLIVWKFGSSQLLTSDMRPTTLR